MNNFLKCPNEHFPFAARNDLSPFIVVIDAAMLVGLLNSQHCLLTSIQSQLLLAEPLWSKIGELCDIIDGERIECLVTLLLIGDSPWRRRIGSRACDSTSDGRRLWWLWLRQWLAGWGGHRSRSWRQWGSEREKEREGEREEEKRREKVRREAIGEFDQVIHGRIDEQGLGAKILQGGDEVCIVFLYTRLYEIATSYSCASQRF